MSLILSMTSLYLVSSYRASLLEVYFWEACSVSEQNKPEPKQALMLAFMSAFTAAHIHPQLTVDTVFKDKYEEQS